MWSRPIARRRVITPWTTLLVAIFGAAVAWWGVPRLQQMTALAAIDDAEADRRAAAWNRLLALDAEGRPRVERHLDAVHGRLRGAANGPLLDAADALGAVRLWDWTRTPRDLRLRELGLRSGADDWLLTANAIADAPLDLTFDDLEPILGGLLAVPDSTMRVAALREACRWAGPERVHRLLDIEMPDDAALQRTLALALAFATETEPVVRALDARQPLEPEVLEAHAFALVRLRPHDTTAVLLAAEAMTGDDRPALAAALRYADDPQAIAALRRWADDGDRAARFALQTRSPAADDQQSRRIVSDPTQPARRRRLAAWRWPRMPIKDVNRLLAADPLEPDGSVYAPVLLAERRLEPDAAARLAEEWMRHFNDDFKRAGALLAALLDVHGELLRRAYDIEDTSPVRTAQRIALDALGAETGPEDPLEFAHRVSRQPSGDFRADVALALLIGGRADPLGWMGTTPPIQVVDYAAAVQQRAWLVERFVPQWHAALGRPLGGDVGSLRLHLDALAALGDLTKRRLAFDRSARTFSYGTPAGPTAAGDRTAP